MAVEVEGLKDIEVIEFFKEKKAQILREIHKAIIGQDTIIDEILVSLFARGHCLIIGVPGLAKTLIIKTISHVFDLTFSRIQFTPDLMPADIIGTEFIEDLSLSKKMKFIRGPVFANIVLADEINRTPPKTQSALLEVMQEYQITVAGTTYAVDKPFFVLATQNPIEQEGTYPLPEAQQDRFMFSLNIDYPLKQEEMEIVETTTRKLDYQIQCAMAAKDVLKTQEVVRNMPVSRHVVQYTTELVRASRPDSENALPFVKDYVTWGAGPRAAQYLILGVKSNALLNGKVNISCEDIRKIAKPVLRHRIFTNFNADADGVTVDDVIDTLLEKVEEPSES
jgi:MoxR-like ATPase